MRQVAGIAVIGALALALAGTAASAQSSGPGGAAGISGMGADSSADDPFKPNLLGGMGNKQVDPETAEKRKEVDRAYRDTTRKIPDQKPADPWGSMRGNDAAASKTAATPKKRANTTQK